VLVEPERTRYDLTFRLFGFPVRAHPWFWVLTLLLFGDGQLRAYGLTGVLIWVVVVFVSILVHEFGHALAFRWFGTNSHIVLYAFGGLAVPWSGVSGRWRRIIISLAGPGAGFVLCAAVFYSNSFFAWADPKSLPLRLLYVYLYVVNLYWGIFNLLPVFPLDGGQVSREVCGSIWPRRGEQLALEISIVVAGLLAVYCLTSAYGADDRWPAFLREWFPGSVWTAILFGMLAVQSYQVLQQMRWTHSHWEEPDDRAPWKR
jgi:Zn-dependent protease